MKSHIKELIAQLSKAEEDKEKIAKEAYNKAMEIKREADKRLEDAHACQMKQANLIERLKVSLQKIYTSMEHETFFLFGWARILIFASLHSAMKVLERKRSNLCS